MITVSSTVSSAQPKVQETVDAPSADEINIDALIPRAESLKSMLKILALMCDEQNHPVQSYLKKQPGRINSVNIVGSVVELLNHIRKLHEDAKVSMPPRCVSHMYLSDAKIILCFYQLVQYFVYAWLSVCLCICIVSAKILMTIATNTMEAYWKFADPIGRGMLNQLSFVCIADCKSLATCGQHKITIDYFLYE